MIYSLTGFSDVHIFPLFFGNDIIMKSFIVTRFSDLLILWNLPKAAKCQCCRLSGSSFTEGLQKRNDDVLMTSFHFLGFRTSVFCETDYKLSTIQVSNHSVI